MKLRSLYREPALGGGALPLRAGLGLKAEHFAHVRDTCPDVGFFEVHAENYLVAGGPMLRHLAAVRADYPLTIHGVGLSIGSTSDLDEEHLSAVAALVRRFEPAVFSEHLAWSSHNGTYFNDLLPLPYNLPTLQRVCRHIDQIQNRMGRPLLLENPSTYLSWAASTWSEGAFMSEVVQRTGCGLLLDVNNVYVSAINQGADPFAALLELPLRHAGQIHLAGFAGPCSTRRWLGWDPCPPCWSATRTSPRLTCWWPKSAWQTRNWHVPTDPWRLRPWSRP
jgi:uncharacterized protein